MWKKNVVGKIANVASDCKHASDVLPTEQYEANKIIAPKQQALAARTPAHSYSNPKIDATQRMANGYAGKKTIDDRLSGWLS
jgi:hypothetical protein